MLREIGLVANAVVERRLRVGVRRILLVAPPRVLVTHWFLRNNCLRRSRRERVGQLVLVFRDRAYYGRSSVTFAVHASGLLDAQARRELPVYGHVGPFVAKCFHCSARPPR